MKVFLWLCLLAITTPLNYSGYKTLYMQTTSGSKWCIRKPFLHWAIFHRKLLNWWLHHPKQNIHSFSTLTKTTPPSPLGISSCKVKLIQSVKEPIKKNKLLRNSTMNWWRNQIHLMSNLSSYFAKEQLVLFHPQIWPIVMPKYFTLSLTN